MHDPHVVFSHGKESGPWGSKIQAMAKVAQDEGCTVQSIDYRGLQDPRERVAKLIEYCRSVEAPLVLVGSSMGGHVATAAAHEVPARGVFLLAPAFYIPGYEEHTPAPPSCPLSIVHGWGDEVVPVDNAVRFAKLCKATVHLLNGDHRLIAHIDEINEYFRVFLALLRGGAFRLKGGE